MKRGTIQHISDGWWRSSFGVFPTHIVQFEVEAAGVAHRVPVGVPPPQGRRRGLTVRARRPRTPSCGLHIDRGGRGRKGGGSHMTRS